MTVQQEKPKSGWLKRIFISLLLIFVVLLAALAIMFSTERGSKFLLDRVLSHQSMLKYQYERGSFLDGLILNNVDVNLDALEIKIKRADLVIGWRAVLEQEVHFSRANIQELQIIDKKPPSNKPFEFSDINMPVTLRLDQANLDVLRIKTTTSSTDLKDLHLKDTLWKGTKLTFKEANLKVGDYVAIHKAKGMMDFKQKYPLNVTAQVDIPSLHAINIKNISVDARGTLDSIAAGFATNTPDLLSGRMIVHPVRENVPMKGQLNFKNYHLPFATDQKLFIPSGTAYLNGSASDMSINLNAELSGKDVPKGSYRADLYVDYVHQMKINQFQGNLMGGVINLSGILNWEKALRWDVKGNLNGLKASDQSIPASIKDFLPPDMDGSLGAVGDLDKGTHLKAFINFNKYEKINFKLAQSEQNPTDPKVTPPMKMNVSWSDMNRAMPYIGWLNSPKGQADIVLDGQKTSVNTNLDVVKNPKGTLPTGQYLANILLNGNDLNIPEFKYITPQGGLVGDAKVLLPTEKRLLKWDANLQAKNFNPQTVAEAAPVDLLNGSFKANGYAEKDAQIIQLKAIDLTGKMAQQKETIQLTGETTASILMNDEKHGGGLRGYGVIYHGNLKSSQYPDANGALNIKIAGTSDSIQVNQFQQEGTAGKILANGIVSLHNGIGWNMNASLVKFKPQYFVSKVQGEVSGVIKTQGVWSDQAKRISIEDLNLAGIINRQILRGKGKLSLVLNTKNNTLVPQQFEANNLFLAYAGNQVQVTGNAQDLDVKLNAPSLSNIYGGLSGNAYGTLHLKTQPNLKAIANINIDRLVYGGQLNVEKVRIRGELPTSETTPSTLKAELTNLNYGNRQIQYGGLTLSGTRSSHIVSLQAWNRYSKFYVQLAGGFNANNDWLGQIQKGTFDSVRAVLNQQSNANVVYRTGTQQLYIGEHCWASNQSKLCFDKPVQISPTSGDVSFVANNLNLNDFSAFMPSGLAMTGEVDGYAKAHWSEGHKPNIDASIIAKNGQIGVASDDPDDPATTTSYQQMSLIAKSVTEGLLMRFDVKTANIGNGYASVVINPYDQNLPMQGELAFSNVDLKFLKPFIQDVRSIGGTLDFAGKVGGTLSKPLATGDLRLKDGSISMISMPVNLTNIQMYSAVRQNQATIMGIFNSGPGTGKIDGFVNWANDLHVQLKVQGDNLLVKQTPLVTALVNTKVDLDIYPMSRSVVVNGKIDIPRAIINMPETSPDVINVSSDARVVHSGDDLIAILKASKPWNIQADIDLSLGDRVVFQGFNSRIPLTGRLYLSQRGSEIAMSANGAIGVSQKVKIEAYGQSLDLNRAIARFNGPLANPTLDIDTTKKISNTTVGVRITGTATTPNIQIYNDGGLSEQEALNALITGRINEGSSSLSQTEGFKSDVNNTLAAAGISLGLGGTRAFTNQIGHAFGLSGLALDAQGTGSDTQVSVTGYITPDLYLRYGVGVFTAVNTLTLRYQMNRRLYLEASESVERAIDVFYNWRF